MPDVLRYSYTAGSDQGDDVAVDFAAVIRMAHEHGRVVIHDESGRVVGAVVPPDVIDSLEAEDEEDIRDALAAMKEPSIPWEELKAELGL